MKTNRTLKLITLTAAIFGFAATSFAQNAATVESVSASAKIISPISLSKTGELNFGNIVKTEGDNIVVLSPNSSASRTASVSGSLVAQGGTSAPQFSVGGENNYTYVVTFPNASITLTGTDANMTVDTFTTSLASNKGTIGDATTGTFYVGATLHVNGNQTEGTYNGSFDVTVTYE